MTDLRTADELLARLSPDEGFAAFDADHTLWHADAGDLAWHAALEERLFRDAAAPAMAATLERLGGAPSGEVHRDARAIYELYKDDRVDELTIVKVMTFCYAGWSVAELRGFGRRIAEERIALARYAEVEPLASALAARGLSIKVVTGSPRLLVEEAVRGWLPLDAERDVLGVELALAGDRFSTDVLDPVTYGEGKVAAIDARLGARPAIAFGDSRGDVPLLGSARARVAVHPRPAMRAAAVTGGWLVFTPERTVSGERVVPPSVDRIIQ